LKEKQKIVILSDWYLPGTKAGGPVRSIFSLTELLKNEYQFYIITTNTDLGTIAPYADVKPNSLFEREGVNYYYFSHEQLNTETLVEIIKNIDPSLVYLNSVWSKYFSINILRAKKNGKLLYPIILAPRGMLSKGALSLKSFKKFSFLFIAKLMKLYSSVLFHATNEEEKRDILKQFPGSRVLIAPNVNSGKVYTVVKPKEVKHIKLFYLSRIAQVKNLHFALEVLKEVPADIQIEYDIYGNLEDKDYWTLCKNIISSLPHNIKVVYRRELQFNEVQSVIMSYHALLLPTLNENFGHSIVESLLCGCPVIISDQTPWNDLEVNNAGYALPLTGKDKFVSALVEIAELDEAGYANKSAAVIRYISGKLSLEKSIKQYKALFDESTKN
jgi:glycosyltransferase involved in cell wall biosynthesis